MPFSIGDFGVTGPFCVFVGTDIIRSSGVFQDFFVFLTDALLFSDCEVVFSI